VVRALKAAGAGHGADTVAKAQAERTAAGEFLNHKDKRGYGLAEWLRPNDTLAYSDPAPGPATTAWLTPAPQVDGRDAARG
jgi:hypothetical protein